MVAVAGAGGAIDHEAVYQVVTDYLSAGRLVTLYEDDVGDDDMIDCFASAVIPYAGL